LPDGIFSNQKLKFGLLWEGLGIELLAYIMVIWNILQVQRHYANRPNANRPNANRPNANRLNANFTISGPMPTV
jgi:hypothetical protein